MKKVQSASSLSEPILKVVGLKKSYGKKQALKNISFKIQKGEILGYLGPNGAGKSTTLNVIADVIKPDAGEIYFKGENVKKNYLGFKRKLSYVPEDGGLYEHLTGAEMLRFIYDLYELERDKLKFANGLLGLLGLEPFKNTQISSYSKGMKQKLLLVISIMTSPELLMLDEPFNGLDAPSTIMVKQIIQEIAKKGKAILFSSHILEVVEKICDRVVIIDSGEVIATGSMKDIMEDKGLETFFTELTGTAGENKELKDALKYL